mgnify:CR=1 FL=1
MPRYTFQIIHDRNNFRSRDIFEELISAPTHKQAQQDIEKVYPILEGYTCTLIDRDNDY